MKVLSYFPYTTTIDGNEIVLRIKRMTMEEWFEFDARFTKVGSPTILRFAARCPEGPEQARDAKGQYRTSFEQILERRLEEMPPDRRAEYEKAVAADEIEAKEFMLDIFDRFVTVERGLTEETSDQKEVSVTAGKDVLRLFGARKDVLTCVLEAVRNENTLDARQKKASSLHGGSSPSSSKPKERGRKRKMTVAPAATEGSAGTAGATATSAGRSGSTVTSLRPAARPRADTRQSRVGGSVR